ncbi:MAG: hypothetical protein A4E65_02336 [Syntrophorhabdus sp. PtaU1.Bin153]|nr:MAG: hypothetical protein A4E65_02336 [Syntrophorhabdus sp. PtaU1.Bin153]
MTDLKPCPFCKHKHWEEDGNMSLRDDLARLVVEEWVTIPRDEYAFVDLILNHPVIKGALGKVESVELQRLIDKAGEFIGTEPGLRSIACIEAALQHAEWLRNERVK